MRSLRTLDFEIFSRGFATSAIGIAIISIAALAFVVFLLWPSSVRWFFGAVHEPIMRSSWAKNLLMADDKLVGDGQNILVNVLLVMFAAMMVLGAAVKPIVQWMQPAFGALGKQAAWVQILIEFLLILTIVATITTALVAVIQLLSKGVSVLLSKMLNPVARDQIRASGFGSDTRSDRAIDTLDFPMWLKSGWPALPEALGQEIQAVSDSAAAKAVQQFRGALGNLALAKGPGGSADLLSKYLTGDELIHTTYFKVARFRKLVAYSLTQTRGLRATPKFMQDPEYALVAGWYQEIVTGRMLSGHSSA